MKTTVDIPDSLLEEARIIASREKTSVKALIQEGLQRVIELRAARTQQFQLRDASVAGNGLKPEFQQAGWGEIRGAAYEGRGA